MSKNKAQVRKPQTNQVGDSDSSDEENPCEVHKVDKVHMLHSKKTNDKFIVHVKIEGKVILMELDTGAALSTISYKDFKSINSDKRVFNTNVTLRTYTGQIIKPRGVVFVNCAYKSQWFIGKLYVLNEDVDPIFGRDWMREVNLDWSEINAVSITDKNDVSKLDRLLTDYSYVFQSKIGPVPNIKLHLDLKPDVKPVFIKPRPIPYARKQKIEDELEHMEKSGIITKVEHSDWGTPIVPVDKPDGSVRICADYKVTVNQAIKDFNYPIPRIEDIYAQMNGGKYFCTLDLSKAYFHLEMDDESALLQSLSTHKGVYRVNRLMFGVKVAPTKFQQFMDQVLQGIEGVQCFFDDIIVQGATIQEVFTRLEEVLKKMKTYNLTLNREKCKFFEKSIEYLGHVIDEHGLHKSQDKISAIVNAKRPENVKELKSFLGMANYYNKFTPNLASTLYPLNSLLKKDKKYCWTKDCEESFEKIKSQISSENVLVHFSADLPLLLATDASPFGLGACLSHRFPDGSERPISFASRSLTSAEKNYSQIDKEATAIFWGMKKYFQYIYESTRRDPCLSDILDALLNGRDLRRLGLNDSEYTLQDGCVFKARRVMIPFNLQREVLKELHVGHVGIVKMKSLARNFCYWKNIDKDIESIAKGCIVCCLKQNEPPMERSHSWEPPTKPWQRLHIDFAGPMSGYYYFVIVDAHSKWVDVIPTKTTTSQWCIKQLRNLFCNFGFPEVLVSDNGPQFTSKVFKDFLEGNGVIHKTSAPFHPSTNGQAERYVQTIKKLLNCMHDEKGDVEYKLSQILIQLRKVPNADGKSPYDLMFQREVRTDFHVMFRSEQEERENQGSRNRREPRRKFDVGDRVQVRNYTREGKWKFGRVLRREGRLHYQVELDEGNVWRRHVDQIRSTCYGGKN
ncbi:uncharacterized protein K02A2.6-like [Diaphorina citri]|nr:uncharacterized protein K02A2.6-like [Diaphorina citri]